MPTKTLESDAEPTTAGPEEKPDGGMVMPPRRINPRWWRPQIKNLPQHLPPRPDRRSKLRASIPVQRSDFRRSSVMR